MMRESRREGRGRGEGRGEERRQYSEREGCSDKEEFHNLLIAHTTKAPLIYIYISRADGSVRPG